MLVLGMQTYAYIFPWLGNHLEIARPYTTRKITKHTVITTNHILTEYAQNDLEGITS